jgi:hypothetical protein
VKLNRLYLVAVSQDQHTIEGDTPLGCDWEAMWDGHGAVRVFALDRDRCMTPVPLEDFKRLLNWKPPAIPPGTQTTYPEWNQTPPVP